MTSNTVLVEDGPDISIEIDTISLGDVNVMRAQRDAIGNEPYKPDAQSCKMN